MFISLTAQAKSCSSPLRAAAMVRPFGMRAPTASIGRVLSKRTNPTTRTTCASLLTFRTTLSIRRTATTVTSATRCVPSQINKCQLSQGADRNGRPFAFTPVALTDLCRHAALFRHAGPACHAELDSASLHQAIAGQARNDGKRPAVTNGRNVCFCIRMRLCVFEPE